MPDTLWESRCLVLGFGRVGKQLSLRLQRLGARVTVAVRKDADRALLEALGLAHDTVAKYRSPLGQYRVIFNTVPAPVFTPAQYDAIGPACVLIDLASAPGGIDASQCLRRSLQFTHARGLQQLFNAADTAVVGHFSNAAALAAVGYQARPEGV